ncbi:hypothetical protein [Brachybacterium sp. Marseille-Q7125]|uniref:hypothetical protein n=1 Tax=Brachybacterium sp. Marseille-Q7125 TaxID=2932815 RepID=UPI001FF28433|nr:hypothetical protein [Brachybacterium sp. Marseille-Q7125]
MRTSPFRRPAALALPVALTAAVPAAALLLGGMTQPAHAAVEIDEDVRVLIETADGPQPEGPLEAAPFTYTVVSRDACTAPYTDGARAVITQEGADPERVVLSGVEELEDDGTARISMDAVLADLVGPGKATLTVECVQVTNGIPEFGDENPAGELTITEDTWEMDGITITEGPEPEQPTDPAPTDPEPTEEEPTEPEPTEEEPSGPADDGTDAPGGDEGTGGGEDASGGTGRGGDAGQAGQTGKDSAGSTRPGGWLARTGVEASALALTAATLIGGGAALAWRGRREGVQR